MIEQLLKDENIHINITSDTKINVIKEMIDLSEKNLYSKDVFLKDVLTREEEMSTGFNSGISIPHSQSSGVKYSFITIGLLKDAVEWGTLDDSVVKLVILIGVPKENEGNQHLAILANLARKLVDDETCLKLIKAKNKQEIRKLLED